MTWVAVKIMFMGNWPCPNWVVPYRLWRFWTSWVFTIWNDQGFRGCSIVVECWSLVNPGLLAGRVFSLACPGFALRANFFNSGPCVGVSSRFWHSLRMPASSSFVLLLYLNLFANAWKHHTDCNHEICWSLCTKRHKVSHFSVCLFKVHLRSLSMEAFIPARFPVRTTAPGKFKHSSRSLKHRSCWTLEQFCLNAIKVK